MFWVISVYFNIRNTLPKSGTFLLGHPVYIYIYICVCVCVCVCVSMQSGSGPCIGDGSCNGVIKILNDGNGAYT